MTSDRGLPLALRWLGRLDSHIRQIVAIAVAVIILLIFQEHGRPPLVHFIALWDVYALVVLLMEWTTILTADPQIVQKTARLQDSSRTIIFFGVIAAACFSMGAVLFILHEHQTLPNRMGGIHLGMAVLAVVESWALIHSMFALRYAHIFYRLRSEDKIKCEGGGLEFPGKDSPDFLDFAYFAFVIGMTCQVADVNITSRFMRREALLHGLLAFAFNTFILALSINVISGLFSK
jgi:uncharacterized membrane protein